jgi:hypothetical protein
MGGCYARQIGTARRQGELQCEAGNTAEPMGH